MQKDLKDDSLICPIWNAKKIVSQELQMYSWKLTSYFHFWEQI